MNAKLGKWTRRALTATLPLGIVLGAFVLVRILLMVSGSEPARAMDIVGLLIQGPMAVALIWSGCENRRALSAPDAPR